MNWILPSQEGNIQVQSVGTAKINLRILCRAASTWVGLKKIKKCSLKNGGGGHKDFMSPRQTSLMEQNPISICLSCSPPCYHLEQSSAHSRYSVGWVEGWKEGWVNGGWEIPDVRLTNFLNTAATVDGAIKHSR